MLPIRSVSCHPVSRRCWLVFVLLLSAAAGRPVESAPVKGLGAEAFRVLIDPPRSLTDIPREGETLDTDGLFRYLRTLHEAAINPKKLPSFGDVADVLLLTEWETDPFGMGAQVPLDQVERAVSDAMSKGNSEAFGRAVRDLIQKSNNNSDSVRRALIAEIKHQSRLDLLNRLKNGIRSSLHSSSASSRIAAANLISDVMIRISRRQEYTRLLMNAPRGQAATPSTVRNLPQSLRELAPDVGELLKDSNPQVQSAGLRGLSDLGIAAKDMADYCRPLFRSSRTDVVARRATANALAHVLEQGVVRIEESGSMVEPSEGGLGSADWAIPYDMVRQLLPVAALGLEDRDADVRARSLQACHAAAQLVDNLARDLEREPAREVSRDPDLSPKRRAALRQERTGRLEVYNATARVVDQILPRITARASDEVPALCVEACRVLELFALASQRMRPGSQPKYKGDTLPPPLRGVQRRPAKKPSQWAAARVEPQAPRLLSLSPSSDSEAPAVTLERPIQLPDTPVRSSPLAAPLTKNDQERRAVPSPAPTGTIAAVSFVVQRMDELRSPTPDPWPAAVEAMIKSLCHPDYRVRLRAVDMLETIEDRAEPAIPGLIERLKDTNKFVRWGSARTLGNFAKRREDKSDPFYARYAENAVTGLIGLLNDQEDPSVRITAAHALEQYAETARKAVPHLARVINRGDKDYILAILHTIQGIGTDAVAALPNVAWVVSDRTQPSSVRIEAARTLGMFGALARNQPRVMSVLRDVQTSDIDPDVRDAASTALLAIESAQ